ncbi:MAG: phosphoglycerate kinase [Parcubacteria group bacterium]
MKTLADIPKADLKDKKILMRVDFNFPLQGGGIGDDFRIRSHIETIDHLSDSGAKVVLISHISKSSKYQSFAEFTDGIGKILSKELYFGGEELKGCARLLDEHDLVLMDNVRKHKEEIENDDGFAGGVAHGFDMFVNDAFAVSHRKHALLVAITKHLPSYAGFVIEREVAMLKKAIDAPRDSKTLVLGGAKIRTKIPVIKNFIDNAEDMLIGGALVYDFLRYKGLEAGKIPVEGKDMDIVGEIDNSVVNLPRDLVTSLERDGSTPAEIHLYDDVPPDHMVLDIGPETSAHFAEIIEHSKVVIWNGPMGLSEIDKFAQGTKRIAEAVAKAGTAFIGGGDTINAVDDLGLLDKIEYVSTGGGAMLAFLGNEKMPALEALGYYD